MVSSIFGEGLSPTRTPRPVRVLSLDVAGHEIEITDILRSGGLILSYYPAPAPTLEKLQADAHAALGPESYAFRDPRHHAAKPRKRPSVKPAKRPSKPKRRR